MKKIIFMLLVLGLMGCGRHLIAGKLELLGYSDFRFTYTQRPHKKNLSFAQNRTNIILSSAFYKKWDFYLNIEFTGAYESRFNFDGDSEALQFEAVGGMELEEAWASYTVSPLLKIRAGVFHAPFGSFNVIQDQSPSFITVSPPMIFDDKFRESNPVSIIPDSANFEVGGVYRKGDFALHYQLYFGNGMRNMFGDFSNQLSLSVGTRLICEINENLRVGLSTYFDTAQYDTLFLEHFWGVDLTVIKEERRLYSIDFDYSFLHRFNVNGEFILNKNNNREFGKFDRTFLYLNANARIVKKVRLYGQLDYYDDKIPNFAVKTYYGNGIYKAVSGINYKPNWKTALKLEVQRVFFKRGYHDELNEWEDHAAELIILPPPNGGDRPRGDGYTVFVAGLSLIF